RQVERRAGLVERAEDVRHARRPRRYRDDPHELAPRGDPADVARESGGVDPAGRADGERPRVVARREREVEERVDRGGLLGNGGLRRDGEDQRENEGREPAHVPDATAARGGSGRTPLPPKRAET